MRRRTSAGVVSVSPAPQEFSTHHKINFKVRLPSRTEWINATVLLKIIDVLLLLLETLIDSRQPNQFEQATAQRTRSVTTVRSDGTVFLSTRPEEVVVEAIAILELKYVREDGMIQQVLSDVRRVHHGLDTERRELLRGANSGKHQKLGGFVDTRRHDDFVLGTQRKVVAIGRDDLNTNNLIALHDQTLRVGLRQDGNVFFALEEDPAGRPDALVDRTDCGSQAVHLTVVDFVVQLLALADPGFLQGVAERSGLRDQLYGRDVEWTVGADVLQILWELLVVIMEGGRLSMPC